MNGSAKGRRWPFCYRGYNGDFDGHIRTTTEQKLNEILLKTFLDDPNSYQVGITSYGIQNESSDSLANDFSKILPSENSSWVPAVFGSASELVPST